jgi:hypothetical protein
MNIFSFLQQTEALEFEFHGRTIVANIYSLGTDRWSLEDRQKVRTPALKLASLQEAQDSNPFEREQASIDYTRAYVPSMVVSIGVKSVAEDEEIQLEEVTDENVKALGDELLIALRDAVNERMKDPTSAETSPDGSAPVETQPDPPVTHS